MDAGTASSKRHRDNAPDAASTRFEDTERQSEEIVPVPPQVVRVPPQYSDNRFQHVKRKSGFEAIVARLQ